MSLAIIDEPFHCLLLGKRGTVQGENYGETGLKLMESMWPDFSEFEIDHSGSICWVYLPDDQMFTGVQMESLPDETGGLESLELTIPRYHRHEHQGPYSDLPGVWADVTGQLQAQGERRVLPSLELYGHCKEEDEVPETSILLAVEPS